MDAGERPEAIRQRLAEALAPESLVVEDEGHLHVGHAGARDGRGHFRVSIVAEAFNGMPMLARHRAVYAALGDLMTTDIHALAIDATASDEL
jgi:BolA protein